MPPTTSRASPQISGDRFRRCERAIAKAEHALDRRASVEVMLAALRAVCEAAGDLIDATVAKNGATW